ncbi:DUF1328 family protein [Lacibacter sp. H375]|uniref:DUF1328 family protein n=1 Tax=Lacibacter sp. H375 TaxID=3133424 RepID=UPI0040403C9F
MLLQNINMLAYGIEDERSWHDFPIYLIRQSVFFTLKFSSMLRWTIIFIVIAIVAAIFGFTGIAAGAASIAKIIFYIFIVLFLLSLLFGRTTKTRG